MRESDNLCEQPDFPVSANGSARPQANSPNRKAGPCICQAGKSRVRRKRALYKYHGGGRAAGLPTLDACSTEYSYLHRKGVWRPKDPSEQPTPPTQSTAGVFPPVFLDGARPPRSPRSLAGRPSPMTPPLRIALQPCRGGVLQTLALASSGALSDLQRRMSGELAEHSLPHSSSRLFPLLLPFLPFAGMAIFFLDQIALDGRDLLPCLAPSGKGPRHPSVSSSKDAVVRSSISSLLYE